MKEVILKAPTQNVVEASIAHWFFEEGDKVEKGQDLVEISFDGMASILPAPASGTLAEVYFETGEVVEIGEVIAGIED